MSIAWQSSNTCSCATHSSMDTACFTQHNANAAVAFLRAVLVTISTKLFLQAICSSQQTAWTPVTSPDLTPPLLPPSNASVTFYFSSSNLPMLKQRENTHGSFSAEKEDFLAAGGSPDASKKHPRSASVTFHPTATKLTM